MNFEKITARYMISVIAVGAICFGLALYWLPYNVIDLNFLVLFCLTIGIGSRISVRIPKFKSHISVSDSFIFLALLMYGGEIAIVLSAVEAFFSSRRFCSRKLTIFFNAAAVAASTTCVYVALRLLELSSFDVLHNSDNFVQTLVITLSVMATVQFLANTMLAAIHDSIKDGIPLFDTWKSKYAWSFVTYFIGAACAGFLFHLQGVVGFAVIIASFPVIFFVFMTYRMYLKNVEISMLQAEQAEKHAEILESQASALKESEERFRSAFNYAPIGIALVAANGKWLKVNHALCKILGFSQEEFLRSDFQTMIFQEDLGVALVEIHKILSGRISNAQMEQRYLHKEKRTVWASWSVSATGETGSGQPNLIFQIQDITDKKVAEAKLQHEASHDPLTGLPNRKMFMARLAQALKKMRLYDRYGVTVLFIDLDRFKYVNDSLGHYIGDNLLIEISKRLKDCLRPFDVVARLGGDEFTILVEGSFDKQEVLRIAERIHQKFSIPFDLDGHEVFSSASIGILHASEEHRSSEDMMRDADTAMYHAKRSGKSRHEVFDEKMREAAVEALQIETDLRRAIENDEIFFRYQPIFSLETNQITGVEALTRWIHPTLGKIPPAKFIAVAEEIGLIDILGEYILMKTCCEVGPILKALPLGNRPSLSVNLSSSQFDRASLADRIESILKATDFPPNRLKLEITESVFFRFQDQAVRILKRLRDIGIEIDIDDFGTGYSSLSYLVRLPLSTLKIDRSFVSPLGTDKASTEIVKTVLILAKNLGLGTTAEGIETQEQLKLLKELGCENGQGFLLARPMNANQLRDFFRNAEALRPLNPVQYGSLPVITTVQ